MGLFDLFTGAHLDRQIKAYHDRIRQVEEECAMVNHGWRLWPENTTNEEKRAALDAYLSGGKAEWYPPGYQEPPIEARGKLQPSDETPPEQPRRKLLGLW